MEKKKYPEPVEALLMLLGIFIGIYIVTEIFAAFVNDQQTGSETTQKQIPFFFIFGSTLFFIIPYLYSRYRNYDVIELFRLNKIPLSVIILSFIAGLSLSILIDELDRLINMIVPLPEWMAELMTPLKVESDYGMDTCYLGCGICSWVC